MCNSRGTWKKENMMKAYSNSSMYRTFCLAGVAILTAALPVSAHCGKCALDGRAFAEALKSGKVTLATATTLAEATAKGVAVRAAVHHADDRSFVEVHCMVADKIMAVEVDCKTGLPGKPVEVKDLESHVSALEGDKDKAAGEAEDGVSQTDIPSEVKTVTQAAQDDKLADVTDVQTKLDEVTKATQAGELDRADESLCQLEDLKNLSEAMQSKVDAARKALDAARALSYAKENSPDLP